MGRRKIPAKATLYQNICDEFARKKNSQDGDPLLLNFATSSGTAKKEKETESGEENLGEVALGKDDQGKTHQKRRRKKKRGKGDIGRMLKHLGERNKRNHAPRVRFSIPSRSKERAPQEWEVRGVLSSLLVKKNEKNGGEIEQRRSGYLFTQKCGFSSKNGEIR